jgi:hypothetical protein
MGIPTPYSDPSLLSSLMCTGLVGAADEDADDAGAPAEPV